MSEHDDKQEARKKQYERIAELQQQYIGIAKELAAMQAAVPNIGSIDALTEADQQTWLDETERTFQQLIISTSEELYWWKRWAKKAHEIISRGLPF